MQEVLRCTVGTDPEFFLRCKKTGKLISAIPHIEGTKHAPVPLPSGGTIQRDNVALEFATEPAGSGIEFVEKIRTAFIDLQTIIPDGYEIEIIPSAFFDKDQLNHPEAEEFGCDPDYDAWTVSMNPKPCHDDETFRSCGAHFHVGHVKGDGNKFLLTPKGKMLVIKGMDTFHGASSILLDSTAESLERRKLYGKSGCHRPTPYGVEYRVLSNFWMKSPTLVLLMDSLTLDVLRLVREKSLNKIIKSIGPDTIQKTINEGMYESALDITNSVLKKHMSDASLEYLEICMNNIDKFNFRKEWKLEEQKDVENSVANE